MISTKTKHQIKEILKFDKQKYDSLMHTGVIKTAALEFESFIQKVYDEVQAQKKKHMCCHEFREVRTRHYHGTDVIFDKCIKCGHETNTKFY